MELASWLHERVPRLAERWSEGIRDRGLGQGTDVDRVIDRFVAQLAGLLPLLLGPHREQVQPLWVRTSELFGVIAAKRGLAAGEVIEEFHVLKELVIRDLYQEPPVGSRPQLSLREVLRLNRALDRGVTHASVGHTDAMFFQFFETDGEVRPLSGAELADEAEAQLDLVRQELEAVSARSPATNDEGVRET